jgi:hypothetical protein
MPKAFERPPVIQVYCTQQPTKKNGMTETMTWRAGVCQDASEVASVITKDRKAMGETFGGLIEPVSLEGRSYRAFRAEWTEIKV